MPANTEDHVLLAFIFISALQVINRREFAQGIPESFNAVDIHTKIEYTVESVTVVMTLITGHSRAQLSAENLMHPGCFRNLRIRFTMRKSVITKRNQARERKH